MLLMLMLIFVKKDTLSFNQRKLFNNPVNYFFIKYQISQRGGCTADIIIATDF